MQKYANSVQDPLGNAIGIASVSVYTDAAHTTLATLYLDNGVTHVTNPLTTNSLGEFSFYAADGRYYIVVSKTGITTQSLDDVLLFDSTASGSSASINFVQSGTGALSRTVQDSRRDFVTSADFDTVANYKTAHAALTARVGVAQLDTLTIDTGSSTASLSVKINGVTQAQFVYNATAVNYWTLTGDPGTGGPTLACAGSATDVHGLIATKGSGSLVFATNGSVSQCQVNHLANALNVLVFSGGVTGSSAGPTIQSVAKGSGDTDVNLTIDTAGAGKIRLDAATGITVPGDASAFLKIGATASITSGISQYGILMTMLGNSDATTSIECLNVTPRTAAASYTCSVAVGMRVNDAVKGSGSAITTLHGIRVDSLTAGTSNIAFRGLCASSTNNYNLYMDGTAQNYLAGLTGIGTTPTTTSALSLPASTTGVSSFNAPHGSAPTSPVNGDFWTTTGGAFIRINGATKTFTLT